MFAIIRNETNCGRTSALQREDAGEYRESSAVWRRADGCELLVDHADHQCFMPRKVDGEDSLSMDQ